MFLLDWYNQYLDIKYSFSERNETLVHCESCETLKLQLSIVNQTNKDLLSRIMEKPVIEEKIDTTELKPITRGALPWNSRRQMLEAEDRDKAKKLKQNESVSIEELEKQLDITSNEREGHAI